MDRARAADPGSAEGRDALVRLRRLMIEADSAFECRARITGVHIQQARRFADRRSNPGVRVVVRAHAREELEVRDRRELQHGIRCRTKDVTLPFSSTVGRPKSGPLFAWSRSQLGGAFQVTS